MDLEPEVGMSQRARVRSTIKVSVVVPVYNPGPHIDGLLASLRHQSLRDDEFEVIFVDDGSTDGTRERLERLAAEVDNVRVIAIPRSGWPGRPRNVGIDAARGEYIQFADNDDELGHEALERLWNYATVNNSDVVVGREERRNRRMPAMALFSRNRPRATLESDPLLDLLTPHKMFRRAFLIERGVRFLEGPRRLEDHHFVMRAYFRADVISVLADYPCYYWVARRDRSNAGSRPHDWGSYYGDVRDILDVVEEHTGPGEFRDKLLSHWYRGKGMRKLSATMAAREQAHARPHFDALRQLTEERFPPTVDEHLGRLDRIRSSLLRAGDFDGYRDLAVALRGLTVAHELEDIHVTEGALLMRVVATLAYADGTPVTMQRAGGRTIWRPPVPLGDAVPTAHLDFTDFTPRMHVIARRASTHEAIQLPGHTEPLPSDADGVMPVGGARTVRLCPHTVDRGRPISLGDWELEVQLSGGGLRAKRLLTSKPSAASLRTLPFASASGTAQVIAVPPGPWRLMVQRQDAPRRSRLRGLARAARRLALTRRAG
jgi:glycosyltransferase involved in cell wall biosynthesis